MSGTAPGPSGWSSPATDGRVQAARAFVARGPWALDGGLASELEARGHDLHNRLWSARLLLDDPEAIKAVHRDYLAAGATVVTSASYQASRAGYEADGYDAATADAMLTRSVELARQAVLDAAASAPRSAPRLAAASVGPYGATRHDGSEYTGGYGVPHADLVRFHRERLAVLAAAGPDLLAVETIPEAAEAAAVVEALGEHPDLPAWICFSCADDATTCGGDRIEDAVAVAASCPTVVAVGVNCTAPRHVTGLLRRAAAVTELPLAVYPNAGATWDASTGDWSPDGVAAVPDAVVEEWIGSGARLVGGCCGLGPGAIADVAAVTARVRAA